METETKVKHTPGPWRIGDAGHTVFGPPNGNPAPEIIAQPRKKANARLIAAAPRLLEAIKLLVEAWDAGALVDPSDVNIARKAIAEAEGTDHA